MTRLIRLTLLMLASGSSFENDHIRQFPGFDRPGSLVDAHSFSDSYSISSYAEADQVSRPKASSETQSAHMLYRLLKAASRIRAL